MIYAFVAAIIYIFKWYFSACSQASEVGMSCTYIDLCPLSPDNRYVHLLNVIVLTRSIFHPRHNCLFYSIKEAELQGQLDAPLSHAAEPSVRHHVEVQQRYVENLRREIQTEQRRAESELEREEAHLQQQHGESE